MSVSENTVHFIMVIHGEYAGTMKVYCMAERLRGVKFHVLKNDMNIKQTNRQTNRVHTEIDKNENLYGSHFKTTKFYPAKISH